MCANNGTVLHQTVVVGENGTRTNVGALTDGGVANVGQVRNLRAVTNLRVLGLAEGAELRPLTQGRTGAQVGEGTDGCALANHGAKAVGADDGSVCLNGHIGQGGVGANGCAGGNGGRAVQLHAGQEGHVILDAHGHVNPGVLRVDNGHAVTHVSLEDAVVEHAAQLSQLHTVVSALNFPTVLNGQGGGTVALRTGDGQHIGNVLLALSVIGGHLKQGFAQHVGVKGVDTGVDLGNLELFGGGVLRLDDGGHLASLVTHDTAVGAGLVHVGGQHGDGVLVLLVESDKLAQSLRTQQGHIAIGHQHGTRDGGLRIQSIQADLNGATGAGDFVLVNDGHVGVESEHVLGDLVALVAHHYSEAFRVQVTGRGNGVLHHGAATNTVHDLGGCGLHARASAGGENNHRGGCQFSVH